MKIIIKYDSSWRNSFLDGDNNQPLPKKEGRKFIGSIKELGQEKNFILRKITIDTVMGVLNRLIGDQRKLYQARLDKNYYFQDIDTPEHPLIQYQDQIKVQNNEMTYIRNMMGSFDKNSFTGAIKVDDEMFTADYANEFWGVLYLEFDELCQFINQKTLIQVQQNHDPIKITTHLESLNKEKPVEKKGDVAKAVKTLQVHFRDYKKFNVNGYFNAKDLVKPLCLYCSALYLQMERLEQKYDMSSAKTKSGCISGISKFTFTKKDFMNRFTTGKKKRIWGNPYIRKERIKGVGEVVSTMTKASGQLEINLQIDKTAAKELDKLIKNAGVSAFYLGKKGLAYIEKIKL